MKEKDKKEPKYGIKNFVRIANEYVNPNTETFDGIQKWLVGWFCFKYNTTPNDDRLLDMTLEELVVLYNMHQIKDNPAYASTQLGDEFVSDEDKDWEKFLEEQMGEDYQTESENIDFMIEEEKEYTERVRAQFPERVTTDFSKFSKEEE